MVDDEAGATVLAAAETKQATGRKPEAGLLSREADRLSFGSRGGS
jgi:hypothetical protein